MSAYALPSSLLSSFSSLSPIGSNSSASALSSNYKSNCTSSANSTPSPSPLSTSAREETENRKSSLSDDSESLSTSSSSWYSTKNDLLISIKSASIDHIRLIQSFTTRRSSSSSSSNSSSSSSSNTISDITTNSTDTIDGSDDDIHEYPYGQSNNGNKNNTTQAVCGRSNNVHNEKSSSSRSSRSFDCNNDHDEQWGEYGDIDTTIVTNNYSHSMSCTSSQQEVFVEQSKIGTNATIDSTVSSSSSSTLPSPPRKQPIINSSNHKKSNDNNNNNVENDAIQFTLAISFNGRTYNATRTLPSFIKLRNDLMMELSNKCNNNKKGVHNNSYNSSNGTSSSSSQSSSNGYKQQHPRSNNDIRSNEVKEHNDDVIIPELPIGVGSNNNDNSELKDTQQGAGGTYSMMGIAAMSGFSGLQAAVLSYCPQMETWLRSVATLAPSSASLANFLWEPINHQQENGQEQQQEQGIASSSSTSASNQQRHHLSSMNKKTLSRSSPRYTNAMRKSSSSTLVMLDSITEDSSDGSDADC